MAIRQSRLANGLRVVTEDVRESRTFSVGVFAAVGSRHEVPALHGASHFLEHVLFKGTARRRPEEIAAAIECVGGELNAYTAKEHTCFYARVRAHDAALALDVLGDMICESQVAADDVESERTVILDEVAMHADDPGELVSELVASEVFAGSTLGQSVIGSPKSLGGMSRDEIVGHWRRHYQPGSLVLAASGQVDHDRLLTMIPTLTAAPAGATLPPGPAPVAGTRSGVVVTREIRLEQSSAVVAFPGPGTFDEARYPLGLLSLVIGGGMASRLFVEVRERRALTYGIDAGETSYSDAGLWTVEWQCAPERLRTILELVRATLLDVVEHGITAAELARAKGQMRGQAELGYESPGARMSRLGTNAVLGDDRSLPSVLDHFDAVTLDQVQDAAAALFPRAPVVGVVGPKIARRQLETLVAHW